MHAVRGCTEGEVVENLRYSLAHSVYILVQNTETPTPQEFEAHLADLMKRESLVSCELVYSAGGSPTAKQRKQFSEAWEAIGRPNPLCAVVSPSLAGPIVVNIINGVLKTRIRAFSDQDFFKALNYLNVPEILHESVCGHVVRHCRALGIKPPPGCMETNDGT